MQEQHADGPGERPRAREDLVRGRRDVVAAGRRQIAHGNDDLLLLTEIAQRRVDLLRRSDGASGRVDAHDDGFHVVVALVLAEQLHDLVGIDARLSVADRPFAFDDPDAGTDAGRQLGVEPRRGRRLHRGPGEHQEPEQHQE